MVREEYPAHPDSLLHLDELIPRVQVASPFPDYLSLAKKKYKEGSYQFGRLLKIIYCDLRKDRIIRIHKIKHGFAQCFQMGRKCRK